VRHEVVVVGAGLAGSEAAWQAARHGARVLLYEMRPVRMTPAHHTGACAELVCSNSLRADSLENAVGLLKAELRRLGSLIMAAADAHRVPAGGALAVDREAFSAAVTSSLARHPRITIRREEVPAIPDGGRPVIIATGPLTSPALADSLRAFTGEAHLYFYDAASPIVTAESIDRERVFEASRYGKGNGHYLNCPMTEDEYRAFRETLVAAERHPLKPFEAERYFEGCLPIEVMAARGPETLRFGPLKPVGLVDPRTGRTPHAVVQLRQDNAARTLYSLVGFQTNLKWPEQKRVFRMIPGLERAEFARLGVMHRNLFVNGPRVLLPTCQTTRRNDLFLAGQITGVEGYVESAASGLVAGINAARLARREAPLQWPPTTAHGALVRYVSTADPRHFQPMNVAFGLLPPLVRPPRGRRERNLAYTRRALEDLERFCRQAGLDQIEAAS